MMAAGKPKGEGKPWLPVKEGADGQKEEGQKARGEAEEPGPRSTEPAPAKNAYSGEVLQPVPQAGRPSTDFTQKEGRWKPRRPRTPSTGGQSPPLRAKKCKEEELSP